jgi:hypothetical protein
MARKSGKNGRLSVGPDGGAAVAINANRAEVQFESDDHDMTGFEDTDLNGDTWQVLVPGIFRGTVSMNVIGDSEEDIHANLKAGKTIEIEAYVDKDAAPYTGKALLTRVSAPIATTEGFIVAIEGKMTEPWTIPANPIEAVTPP